MGETLVTPITVLPTTDLEACFIIKIIAWSCENGEGVSIGDIFEDSQNGSPLLSKTVIVVVRTRVLRQISPRQYLPWSEFCLVYYTGT
jgi:hypothetical protein